MAARRTTTTPAPAKIDWDDLQEQFYSLVPLPGRIITTRDLTANERTVVTVATLAHRAQLRANAEAAGTEFIDPYSNTALREHPRFATAIERARQEARYK